MAAAGPGGHADATLTQTLRAVDHRVRAADCRRARAPRSRRSLSPIAPSSPEARRSGKSDRTRSSPARSSSPSIRRTSTTRASSISSTRRERADGRVHFSADLYVLRPSRTQKGNGALLFEIANRGRKGLLGRFNRGAGGSQDPTAAADFGDGFLMKEGYTLVWVGWQFDVQPPLVRIEAPAANVRGSRSLLLHRRRETDRGRAGDLPAYPPARRERSDGDADGSRSILGSAVARAIATSGGSHVQNARVRITLDEGSSRGASTKSTTRPPAPKLPAPAWRQSVMPRQHSAIAPTCPFAAARRTSSARHRAAASCVSSCTTASTWTKRIAARSISCGRTSPAPDKDRSTNGSRRPATTRSRRRDSRTRIPRRPGPTAKRDGILAAYRADQAAEGDLHEHVGRILGPGALRRADAHDARRRPRRCRAGERAHLPSRGHAAWRGGVSADAGTGTGTREPDATGQCHASAASRGAPMGRVGHASSRTAAIPRCAIRRWCH